MSQAIISIGSSLGDRTGMLRQALSRISVKNKILLVSDVYETIPKDENGCGPYLNSCILIETKMRSPELSQFLADVQKKLLRGENEDEEFHQQDIDLDLIAFDKEVIRTPQLTLPHPSAHRRAFVMIPLASICPDWVHPILEIKASELARATYWTGWGTFFAPAKSLLDF